MFICVLFIYYFVRSNEVFTSPFGGPVDRPLARGEAEEVLLVPKLPRPPRTKGSLQTGVRDQVFEICGPR